MKLAIAVACSLGAAFFVGSVYAEKAGPKNVIPIMADDSAADNYGCYSSTFFKTPSLDELAARGETARAMLQKAIDSMPVEAAKLVYEDKGGKEEKELKK